MKLRNQKPLRLLYLAALVPLLVLVLQSTGNHDADAAVPPPAPTGPVAKKGLVLTTAYQKMSAAELQDSMQGVGLWSNPRKDWNAGWFYNYDIDPGNLLEWSARSGIEFVPMFNAATVALDDGTRCALDRAAAKKAMPLCELERLSRQLGRLAARYRELGGRPPAALLGFNEPYTEFKAGVSPQQAATIYARYLIPLAKTHGLRLSSPTFVIPGTIENNKRSRAFRWYLDFVTACEQSAECDADAIEILNIHNYDCRGSYWDAVAPGGFFYTRLAEGMHKNNPGTTRARWDAYFAQRKIWVTETNCNHTGKDNRAPENSLQACRMATGSESKEFGIGSLAALNRSTTVERFAWWTVHNDEELLAGKTTIDSQRLASMMRRHETADLISNDGRQLTPAGRAYRFFDTARSDSGPLCQ